MVCKYCHSSHLNHTYLSCGKLKSDTIELIERETNVVRFISTRGSLIINDLIVGFYECQKILIHYVRDHMSFLEPGRKKNIIKYIQSLNVKQGGGKDLIFHFISKLFMEKQPPSVLFGDIRYDSVVRPQTIRWTLPSYAQQHPPNNDHHYYRSRLPTSIVLSQKFSLPMEEGFDDCPICLTVNCANVETNCHHRFCFPCISIVLNSANDSCPMCRTSIIHVVIDQENQHKETPIEVI